MYKLLIRKKLSTYIFKNRHKESIFLKSNQSIWITEIQGILCSFHYASDYQVWVHIIITRWAWNSISLPRIWFNWFGIFGLRAVVLYVWVCETGTLWMEPRGSSMLKLMLCHWGTPPDLVGFYVSLFLWVGVWPWDRVSYCNKG